MADDYPQKIRNDLGGKVYAVLGESYAVNDHKKKTAPPLKGGTVLFNKI